MNSLYGETSAILSPCRKYRYVLKRIWDKDISPLVFVMLNPSTANENADDPTIRRCLGFAKDLGYGGIVVVNLFALRSSDPGMLRYSSDPVGPDNDKHLVQSCAGQHVIVAWGRSVPSTYRERPDNVLATLQQLGGVVKCLGKTKGGSPKHPLYVPAGMRPVDV